MPENVSQTSSKKTTDWSVVLWASYKERPKNARVYGYSWHVIAHCSSWLEGLA